MHAITHGVDDANSHTDTLAGPAGAAALAEGLGGNEALKILDISGFNMIQDEGAISVASALKDNTVLSELWIGDNDIGDAGAIAIADMLAVNTAVSALHMLGNQIGDEGGLALKAAIDSSTVLHTMELEVEHKANSTHLDEL